MLVFHAVQHVVRNVAVDFPVAHGMAPTPPVLWRPVASLGPRQATLSDTEHRQVFVDSQQRTVRFFCQLNGDRSDATACIENHA